MDNLNFALDSNESEHRYQALRKGVADCHYHVQVEAGKNLQKIHSLGCEKVTGYKPAEYAADPQLWNSLVVEQDRPLIKVQLESVLSGNQPEAIQFRIHRSDGQIRWIKKIVVPYHDAQGQLIAYDSLLTDITEQKRAHETLRESEERFRLLFEDDLTGNYLASPNGEVILCNQAFLDIFGFQSREEAIGSSLANLYLAPLSWPEFLELIIQNKALERCERTSRHRDGTSRYVIETAIGSFNAAGDLIRIKGYIYDDTNSKVATAKLSRRNEELERLVEQRTNVLREQHEHLKAVWHSAFDAIITIDRNGLITTSNRTAEKMFGYSAEELIGQNVKMLMPKPYRDEHDGYIERYHKSGQPRILNTPRELVAQRKDGSTFPIDLSVTQVAATGYFTGIIRDISDRKDLQRHLLEISSEEQRRIGRELHDGTGQELTGLSLIADALFEMIKAIPTTIVSGKPQRQLDEMNYARIHDAVAKIASRLIEANRNVHKLSHGIMPVQIDAEALRSALEELAASSNMPPKIHCRFDCPQPVNVANNTSATHLFRIAQEAVNNAIRHSQADEIVILLKQNGREIILEVLDNGIGMVEPYGNPSHARNDGGMGMRTMKYRAGMIGGTLQIDRRRSGGTSVKCVCLLTSEG
jgi:two-component system, LuxR family, sensor kinase FixL